MIGLTPKQRQLYNFIAAEIAAKGVAPTLSEMQTHLGLSSKAPVHALLTALEQRGWIRRLHFLTRAIEIVRHPPSTVTLHSEILTLTDRYAAQESISRDTATNQIMREWLEAYFRRAA